MTAPVPSPDPERRIRLAPVLWAVVATGLGLWMLAVTVNVWLLVFVSILGALYLTALRGFLMRRLKLHPAVALGVAIVLTIAALVGLLWLLVPPVVNQTEDIINALPHELQIWDAWVTRLVASLPGVGGSEIAAKLGPHPLLGPLYQFASGAFPTFFSDVSRRAISTLGALVTLVTVGVMSIYLALYPNQYRDWFTMLFPPRHHDFVRNVLNDLGRTLKAYIVAQIATMALLGIITAPALWLLQVPYALTFGVLAALCALVPYFGVIVATIFPALFVIGGPNGLTRAVIVFLVGNAIHVVWGNFIAPLVMEREVDLPAALIIVAILLAGELLGALGVLVAVPLLAVVTVLLRSILIERVYAGEGFRMTVR